MSEQDLVEDCDQGHRKNNLMSGQYFKHDSGQGQPPRLTNKQQSYFLWLPHYIYPSILDL